MNKSARRFRGLLSLSNPAHFELKLHFLEMLDAVLKEVNLAAMARRITFFYIRGKRVSKTARLAQPWGLIS